MNNDAPKVTKRGKLKIHRLLVGFVILLFALSACRHTANHDLVVQAVDVLPGKLVPGVYSRYNELQIALQVYETLLRLSEDRKTLLPQLARSWSYSADFGELTLQLKPGIHFHDGTILDAEASKYSIDWLKEVNPASAYLSAIDSVTVADSLTIRIHLNRPDSRFLYFLASGIGPVMISPTALTSLGEGIFKQPVGTGPFKLYSWNTHSIRLRACDFYRERSGNVRELKFVRAPYSGQLEQSLQKGRTDVVYAVRGSTIDRLQWSGEVDYIVNQSILSTMLAFNLENELTGDLKIRSHLLSLLDIRKLIINNNRGSADLASNPLPSSFKGFSDLNQKAHLTGAERTAGYRIQQPGKALTIFYPEEAFLRPTLLLGIKSDIMKGGYDIKLRPVKPSDDYFEIISRKSTQLFMYGWRSDILGDPGNFLWSLFHSGSPYNFFKYKSAEVDRLLEKAVLEFDHSKRHDYYRQVVGRILEDTPAVFINHMKEYYAYNKTKIQSISMSPYGIINYKDVVINEASRF